jgi:3-methyladenine DNA glycosylase/8-oxoguanine DNA glycosylase
MPIPGGSLVRFEPLPHRVDLRATLSPLRRGVGDPCTVFQGPLLWRATRTPAGPATLRLRVDPGAARLEARAWGPGASWALDHVRDLVGADDDASELDGMLAGTGGGAGKELLRALHRRSPGLRMPATGAVTEALVPTILEQKVTGIQARRSYQWLVRRLGTPAPGPAGLRLPPAPAVLASTPSWVFHRAGVEGKRAGTLVHACGYAHRLDEAGRTAPAETRRRLGALPGVGPWSVAEVSRVALGDADAVSVGDYHLHDQVAWALAGVPRGDDDLMLELLEPYRGQRGRVTRLIESAGITAPRYGARLSIQAIEAI